jgi:hypothetical protein
MATKQKVMQLPGSIDPDRLYTPEELSPLCGLAARRLKRMMDEGRIGYVLVGNERGRMIEGQQYLDWKASRRVAPEAA